MTTGKLVRVRWHDAHAIGTGWMGVDEIDAGPRNISTVGWVIHGVKAGHLVLVGSVDDDMIDGGIAIPIGMIREIVELVDGARLPVEQLS